MYSNSAALTLPRLAHGGIWRADSSLYIYLVHPASVMHLIGAVSLGKDIILKMSYVSEGDFLFGLAGSLIFLGCGALVSVCTV